MKLYFNIPQMPYIVFELLKIKIDDYVDENYVAESVDTIYLQTFPEQYDFRLRSRDAMTQTDSEVFLNKYDFAPERLSFNGTFGVKDRGMMSGYNRLKQFEKEIILRSKTASLPGAGDGERFIYVVNFYGFEFGKFGNINVSTWNTRGNARENSDLIRYSFEFDIIGKLVKTNSKDYLLTALNGVFGADGLISDALDFVNSNETVQDVYQGMETMKQIVTLPQQGLSFVADTITNAIKDVGKFVTTIPEGGIF
jgi:hypothetical protein